MSYWKLEGDFIRVHTTGNDMEHSLEILEAILGERLAKKWGSK